MDGSDQQLTLSNTDSETGITEKYTQGNFEKYIQSP